MKKNYLLMIALVIILVLAGCSKDTDISVTEEVELLTFDFTPMILVHQKYVTVDTSSETYLLNQSEVTYYKSHKEKTEFKYQKNLKGDISDMEIHIGTTELKGYSKEYADMYSTTMKVLEPILEKSK